MSIDNICKYLSEQYPESFANWLLGEDIPDVALLKTELSVEPIRADFVALLRPQERMQAHRVSSGSYFRSTTAFTDARLLC